MFFFYFPKMTERCSLGFMWSKNILAQQGVLIIRIQWAYCAAKLSWTNRMLLLVLALSSLIPLQHKIICLFPTWDSYNILYFQKYFQTYGHDIYMHQQFAPRITTQYFFSTMYLLIYFAHNFGYFVIWYNRYQGISIKTRI